MKKLRFILCAALLWGCNDIVAQSKSIPVGFTSSIDITVKLDPGVIATGAQADIHVPVPLEMGGCVLNSGHSLQMSGTSKLTSQTSRIVFTDQDVTIGWQGDRVIATCYVHVPHNTTPGNYPVSIPESFLVIRDPITNISGGNDSIKAKEGVIDVTIS